MSWLITIITGLIIGWLAGLVSGSYKRFGTSSDIASGIAGSIIGYWLYASVFGYEWGVASINLFSWAALLWESVAAIVWIGVMNFIRAQELKVESKITQASRSPSYGYEFYEQEEANKPEKEKGENEQKSKNNKHK